MDAPGALLGGWSVGGVRLIDGALPWVLVVAALAAVALAVRWADGERGRRWLPALLAVSLGATTIVVHAAHHVGGLIGDPTDDYPGWINVVVWAAFFFVGVAILPRDGRPAGHRIVSVAACVACFLVAGDQLAIRYGYPADLRTLAGFEVQGATRFSDRALPAPTAAAVPPEVPPAASPPPTLPTTPDPPASPASSPPTKPLSSSSLPSAVSTVAVPDVASSTTSVVTALEAQWVAPPGLRERGEVLSEVAIPATISGFAARSAYVYLPPAYFAEPRPVLPVLVLLSGVPGQPKNWLAGLDTHKVFDRYAAAHHGLAPILVFPDYNGGLTGDKGCVDSNEGNIETYLTRDVPAFVTATFAPGTGPAHWGIGGFSDGGTCALVVGLRHPDLFGVIVDFSGDVGPNVNGSVDRYVTRFLGGDAARYAAHDPMALLGGPPPSPTAILLEAGDGEPKKKAGQQQLADTARAHGWTVDFVTRPGRHDFTFWRQCIAEAPDWIGRQLGLTA